MPTNMNRGPEIYDPDALKSEYSRSEREAMAPYASKRRPGGRKISLKILLLDLLLLCILGGILYPYIIGKNKEGVLDGIRFRLYLSSDEDSLFVSLMMENPSDGNLSDTLDIQIFVNEKEVESLSDLTPSPGESRTLRFRLTGSQQKDAVRIVVNKNSGHLELNAVSSE